MDFFLLFFIDETMPTFRSDIAVLFGKYLPCLTIRSDIVACRTSNKRVSVKWEAGNKLLCTIYNDKFSRHIISFSHFLRNLLFIDLKRYHAIQVRNMPLIATVGCIIARLRNKAFFYWMSYPVSEGHLQLARHRKMKSGFLKFIFPWIRGQLGRFLIYRIVLPNSNHIFVQSQRMKAFIEKMGIPSIKITPVPMGIDLYSSSLSNILPADDPRLKGKRVIVYLGTLDPPRKINILFDMLSIVKNRFQNVLLVIVGDTHDEYHRKWLHRLPINMGISDNIIWTGWLPQYKGWQYILASEIGLSPIPRSFLLDNSTPTKILEYIALGVPVVANDNPDQSELIKATGAGICVPYTAESFANAVIYLLMKNDSGIREQINSIGLDYLSKKRSYMHISNDLAKVYKKLFNSFN